MTSSLGLGEMVQCRRQQSAAIRTLNAGLATGYEDRSRAFLILHVRAIGRFACCLVAAIANIRRSEVHTRLMVLATISLLQAAMGRVSFELVTGRGPGLSTRLGEPPPLIIGLDPTRILELLLAACVIYDW